jgi:hypothetical protein
MPRTNKPLQATTSRQRSLTKGISPILNQSIMISVSIMVIILVITIVNRVSTDYKEFVGRNEIKEVCYIIRAGIEYEYWPGEYSSASNTTYGKILVNLPEKIAGLPYRAEFVNTSLELKMEGDLKLNYTCSLNFPVSYNGSSTGGLTELKWIQYDNGTDLINMRRV